MSQHAQTLMNV